MPSIALNETELSRFYSAYFPYFNTLSPEFQKRFLKRCLHFISSKNIKGADGFEVNTNVKAIISASAVQLSLGLDTWDYDYFIDIIIHPHTFTNEFTQREHKGETNLGGYIKFSWLSFIQGYKNPNDNINLGIHEFTHALRFNGIRGNEEDYFMKYFFTRWLHSAYSAFNDLKAGRPSVFRKYGGANMNEFISVCVEHYFESPLQIKEQYPVLFYNTAILLNQLTLENVTHMNIRESMMKEKNEGMFPMPQLLIRQSVFKSSTIQPLYITGFLWLLTCFAAGFLSGPSVVLFAMLVFFYLRFDYLYLKLFTSGKSLLLMKGFYFFKTHKPREVMLSQIISLRQTRFSKHSELQLRYYNLKDGHFYDESMECPNTEADELLRAIAINKIATAVK
jgi:MtfA peptidase